MSYWSVMNTFYWAAAMTKMTTCWISAILFVSIATQFPVLMECAIVCPSTDDFFPCRCSEYGSSNTISLDCRSQELDDSKTADVLSAFVSTPGVSPVAWIDLHYNQLTRIPAQIRSFTKLVYIDISFNAIDVFQSGDFNFASSNKLTTLWGNGNQLTSIAPGAFGGNGYGSGSYINLYENELTRFESAVFKPLLDKLEPFSPNTYISIANNPFDCQSNPCHLAWLIRDHSELLLSLVRGATCSNGTRFEELDPSAFSGCPLFVCPVGYDGQYADPASCSRYYLCVAGVGYPVDCPKDLVFNPDTGLCDQVINVVSCNPNKPFVCPSPNGQFPNPESCTSYYICVDSTPYLQNCPNGLYFNPNTNQCDNPANVPTCS